MQQYNILLYHIHKSMLNKPTYPIVTMVAMGTLQLLGEKWLLWEVQFFKTYVFKTFCFFFCQGTNYESTKKQKMCINIKNYQNTFSVAMTTSLLPQNETKTITAIERIWKFARTLKINKNILAEVYSDNNNQKIK